MHVCVCACVLENTGIRTYLVEIAIHFLSPSKVSF